MQKPKLSIIIVSYNTKDLTLACLGSIERHPYSGKFEVIVVDNASTDGSVSVIKKAPVSFKLKLVSNKTNLGFPKGNNRGIEQASGEYILLLNSDTEVNSDALDKLVEFASYTESAGVVGPRLLNPDGTTQGSVFRFPTLVRTIREYWLGKKGQLGKYSPKGEKAQEVEVISMAAFLITPEAKKDVGLLNERYFMFFEDFDYCRRVHGVGLKVFFYPGVEITHHHGASGKDIAESRDQWRRLIPSSKIYHGLVKHYLILFVMWSGQKLGRLLSR